MTRVALYAPPGPGNRYPGELRFALRHRPLPFLLRTAERFPGVARFDWDGYPVYLLTDPDCIATALLLRQHEFVRSGGPPRLARLLGGGLLRSHGETHRRQRRLAQPAFHPRQLERYGAAVVEEAEAVLGAHSDGPRFDFHAAMTRLTLAVVARTFFRMTLDGGGTRVGAAAKTAIETLAPGAWAPLEAIRRRRFESALRELDDTVARSIADRRAVSGGDDLLSALVAARDDEGDGTGMSDAQLRDEVMTLLVAGHETTASVLAWAGHLLAAHPDAQERLHREVVDTLGDRLPAVADLPRLSYARGVFAEALRLYPPAWILFRRARVECRLPLVGRELVVPAGANVCVSPYVLGRLPRCFPRPLHFRPERWGGEEESRLPKGSFLPFGLGQRRCLGEAFAWNEGILTLAVLARRWRLIAARGARVCEAPLFTLRPKGGVPVRLVRR